MSLANAISSNGIDTLYRRHRLRVMLAITLGYGFIYTCRLGLSIVKKPLIDEGIFTVEQLGMIGAAMGLVGIFSYLGAAVQETVSAGLIAKGVTMVDGIPHYDFDTAILFWISSSVLSMLLAASLWNAKVRD